MLYDKNLFQLIKLTFVFFFLSLSSTQSSPSKISILQLIEHPALDVTREGFLEELNKLGYREGENLILEKLLQKVEWNGKMTRVYSFKERNRNVICRAPCDPKASQ